MEEEKPAAVVKKIMENSVSIALELGFLTDNRIR